MNKKIYLLVFWALYSLLLPVNTTQGQGVLWAQNESAGTTGFAFMKMNYSARAMGMANAFSALSNDGDAVFFNPAGLTQNDHDHIKTTFMNYVEGLAGGSVVYLTNYSERWKIAPFIQFLASDAIPKTIESNGNYGGQIGSFHTFSMVAGSGFAMTVNDSFDIGFNLKYFFETLDSATASAVAGDFSVLHQTNNENLKIGVTLKNIGTQLSYYTDTEYNEGLPSMFIAGASYKLTNKNDVVKGFINFDLVRPFDNDFFGRLGTEFYYNTYFTLRAGLDTRMEDYKTGESLDILSGLSLGVGFNWDRYVIDYSISSMGGFGYVNQMSVSYLF